jgi:hypothetical protein
VNTAAALPSIAWPAGAGVDALQCIDRLVGRTLILPTAPLTGRLPALAEALDWRLSGRIGRRIASERFTGASGERLLVLLPDQPWPMVCMLGFGAALDPDVFSASLAQVRGLRGANRVWLDPEPAPAGWRDAAPRWLRAAGEVLVLE